MTRVFRNVVLPGLILAAGIGVFAGLVLSKEPPQRVERPRTVPRVEVLPIEAASPGGFGIEVNGTVVPKREVTLSAEVDGRVIDRTDACWAGRSVAAGDVLMRLETQPLEIRRQSLEAEKAQVQADLEQLDVEIANTEEMVSLAEQDVDLRRREQQRINQQVARNVSSASERDAADSQVLNARQTLQTLLNDRRTFASRRARLEAELKGVAARQAQVDYELSRTTITSPVDGRIVEVRVEQDAYARTGDPLVTIEDTSAMEVRCSLQLEDLYWLAGGDDPYATAAGGDPYAIPHAPAAVSRSLAGQSSTWDGVLARYEGTGIDERTRTVPCRVEVDEPSGLRRGMFVSVRLSAGDPRVPMLSVPRGGFRPNNEVWLVEDGRLSIRRVEPVRVLEDAVLIRGDGPGEPIAPGASLVVSPLEAPVEAMEIDVDKDEAPAASEAPAGAVASRNVPRPTER